MKSIRYIFIFFIVLSVIFTTKVFSIITFANTTYDFENFTEDDALSFIEEHNIEVPNKMLDWEKFGDFTKNLIVQSYRNPNIPFSFNYYKTQKYAEDIRLAVGSYVNKEGISKYSKSTYNLRWNTVMDEYGNWVTSGGYYNQDWREYNCYAYSINRREIPHFYHSLDVYTPGDMSSLESVEIIGANIETLAEFVKNDLEAMGYLDVTLFDYIPTVNETQELICIRNDYYDYHCMRYDQATDAWYHKPGDSAILKYNYIPSNDISWLGEWSVEGIEALTNISYSSDIIFIRYSKNIINTSSNNFKNIGIQQGKDVLYELNFDTIDHYILRIMSYYDVKYEVYNSDFDVVLSGLDNDIYTCLAVDQDKYYLRMNFESNLIADAVSVSLFADYDDFTYLDDYSHSYICNGCGYTKFSLHNFECYESTESLHTEICTDCEYSRNYLSNPQYANIDDNNHIVSCLDCEYSITEGHTYEAQQFNAFQHNLVCACGKVKDEKQGHIWTGDWGGLKCLLCGYKKPLAPGDDFIIIKGQDPEIEEETE